MQPTEQQRHRAADLVPQVAKIAGLEHSYGYPLEPEAKRNEIWPTFRISGRFVPPLDIEAFQVVVLALPVRVAETTFRRAYLDTSWTSDYRWLLTPAGMLAFYEALVADGA